MKTIPLGSTVKCVVSGVQGIAQTMTETFNGNIRYGVQPQSEDGKTMPDAWDIDQQVLDVVDDGISARASAPTQTDIKVGERVTDVASGFTGIASSKTTHLNGCVFFIVVPKIKDASLLNEAPSGSYIDATRLKRVDEGVTETVEEVRTEPKRTGGPSTRSIRA